MNVPFLLGKVWEGGLQLRKGRSWQGSWGFTKMDSDAAAGPNLLGDHVQAVQKPADSLEHPLHPARLDAAHEMRTWASKAFRTE